MSLFLKDKIPFLAESIPSGASVLSLGLGDGEVELAMLRALAGKGSVAWGIIDAGAGTDGLTARCGALGIKPSVYMGTANDFPGIRGTLASPLVVCCLGNRFCGYDPAVLLPMLARSLSSSDLFLMDCRLFAQDAALERPDVPFPAEQGMAPDAVEIRDELVAAVTPAGQAFKSRRVLRCQKDCRLGSGADGLQLRKGEEIELGYSYRFKLSQVLSLLKRERFHVVRMFLNDTSDTCVILSRPLGEAYLQYSIMGR